MQTAIQLLVGLGNPGPRYSDTRHNAGAWFIETFAAQQTCQLRLEAKFHGQCGNLLVNGHECRLLIPNTFMNLSGQSVLAMANFYRIPPEAILIAHDDLDLAPGMIRLKQGGGHGGHNGLRDIIAHLNSNQFQRLRIGIGHPGNSKEVADYVLARPAQSEQQLIDMAIAEALTITPLLLDGQIQKAMRQLHTVKQTS